MNHRRGNWALAGRDRLKRLVRRLGMTQERSPLRQTDALGGQTRRQTGRLAVLNDDLNQLHLSQHPR
jgi:hypothetical protein